MKKGLQDLTLLAVLVFFF